MYIHYVKEPLDETWYVLASESQSYYLRCCCSFVYGNASKEGSVKSFNMGEGLAPGSREGCTEGSRGVPGKKQQQNNRFWANCGKVLRKVPGKALGRFHTLLAVGNIAYE